MDERTWGPLLMVPILVAVIAPIAWVAINGRRWLLVRANHFLQKLFIDADARSEKQEDYVYIRFPVYFGALFTLQELTASAWIPTGKARSVINSLAVFSITHGVLTIFAPYTLFMVAVNYLIHIPKFSKTS